MGAPPCQHGSWSHWSYAALTPPTALYPPQLSTLVDIHLETPETMSVPTNIDASTTSTTSTIGRRNQESRNYFTSYTPPSSTEAINGPVREPAREHPPISDRLIVGVDFGTTFSG